MDERSGGEPFRGHTTSLRDWVDLIGHAEVRGGEGCRQFRGLTASDRRVRGSKEDVRLCVWAAKYRGLSLRSASMTTETITAKRSLGRNKGCSRIPRSDAEHRKR